MTDLVAGRYQQSAPFDTGLGRPNNATQSNIPGRSNAEFPFMGSLQDAAAALVSGKMTVVAVPVTIGDTFTKVSVFVGGTAASTPTHSWAAIYSGTTTIASGAIQGVQSVDGATAAIAASGRFDFTLPTAVIVTNTNAPNGYLWVAVSETASTVSSLNSFTVPTACQYAWYTNTPSVFAETVGSALAATAPATIGSTSATALATPPMIVLT